MAKKLDAAVMEIMRDYNPRNYLDGEDLQNYDTAEQFQVDLQHARGEAAINLCESAAQFLELPRDFMSEQNADLGVMFELSAYTNVLRQTAASAFGETYKTYAHEAFNLLSNATTQVILSQRAALEKEANACNVNLAAIRATMANGPVRIIFGPNADGSERPPFTDTEILANYVVLFFSTDVMWHHVMLNHSHLYEVLQHAGGAWPKRWTEKQAQLFANKWTLKAPNTQPSHSVPKITPTRVQTADQPSHLIFDHGPEHDRLMLDGIANYTAKKGKKNIACAVSIELDDTSDIDFDPLLDRINPRDFPVHNAVATICHDYIKAGRIPQDALRDGHTPVTIVIPLGTLQRSAQMSDTRLDKGVNTFDEILASLSRMMSTAITVHCSDEAREHGFDGSCFVSRENVLTGSINIEYVNGQKCLCLVLSRVPILLRYAATTHKMLTYDERYIIGGPRKRSMDVLAIRDYLARRLFTAIRYREEECRIRLDTLTACLAPTTSAEQVRANIKKMLQAWAQPSTAERYQLIKDSAPMKSGNKIIGYNAILLPRRSIQSFELPPKGCQTLLTP